MENEKKYVNMALVIVAMLIIVITSVISTIVVYNFVLDTTKAKTKANETVSTNYENELEKENLLVEEVSYIEIQVDNSGEDGLSYTDPLKIEDIETIEEIKNIINSAEEITIESAGGFFGSCPIATIYQ